MLRTLWETIVNVLFFWWDPLPFRRSGLGMSDDWAPGDPVGPGARPDPK